MRQASSEKCPGSRLDRLPVKRTGTGEVLLARLQEDNSVWASTARQVESEVRRSGSVREDMEEQLGKSCFRIAARAGTGGCTKW